jgi:hypothetical protein
MNSYLLSSCAAYIAKRASPLKAQPRRAPLTPEEVMLNGFSQELRKQANPILGSLLRTGLQAGVGSAAFNTTQEIIERLFGGPGRTFDQALSDTFWQIPLGMAGHYAFSGLDKFRGMAQTDTVAKWKTMRDAVKARLPQGDTSVLTPKRVDELAKKFNVPDSGYRNSKALTNVLSPLSTAASWVLPGLMSPGSAATFGGIVGGIRGMASPSKSSQTGDIPKPQTQLYDPNTGEIPYDKLRTMDPRVVSNFSTFR